MFFEGLGTIALTNLRCQPNRDAYYDGTMMIFDVGDNSQLLVSVYTTNALWCTNQDGADITYKGTVGVDEWEVLNSMFFKEV